MFPGDDREREMAKARAIIAASDKARLAKAEAMFASMEGLGEVITTQVLPNLVLIRTSDGIRGVGFFQFEEWFVSNAHVLPMREILDEAEFFNIGGEKLSVELFESYHRPTSDRSPDLVIVKMKGASISHGLPLEYEGYGDETLPQSHYFYISLGKTIQIKFLKKISKEGTCPEVYQCINGTFPEPGDSGSLIMEATLPAEARDPKWKIKTVGALYARASAKPENIYSIPLESDFKQIREILIAIDASARSSVMSTAALSLKDKFGKVDALTFASHSHKEAELAKAGLLAFETGSTPLNLTDPEDLQRLLGGTIVRFEHSVLRGESILNDWGFKNKRERSELLHPRKSFPEFSAAELTADFEALLTSFEKLTRKFPSKPENNFHGSTHFRIDFLGAKDGTAWRLEVQDNTDAYYKSRSPSLSSTFAIVCFPKTMVDIIPKKTLADQLRESSRLGKPIDISTVSASSVAERGRSTIVRGGREAYVAAGRDSGAAAGGAGASR